MKHFEKEESIKIINEIHSGVCGGYYMAKTKTQKVTRLGFWWPTLFKDAHKLVRECYLCERFFGK